jgi:hypothetical protein
VLGAPAALWLGRGALAARWLCRLTLGVPAARSRSAKRLSRMLRGDRAAADLLWRRLWQYF